MLLSGCEDGDGAGMVDEEQGKAYTTSTNTPYLPFNYQQLLQYKLLANEELLSHLLIFTI
jgi:hypothetical protein